MDDLEDAQAEAWRRRGSSGPLERLGDEPPGEFPLGRTIAGALGFAVLAEIVGFVAFAFAFGWAWEGREGLLVDVVSVAAYVFFLWGWLVGGVFGVLLGSGLLARGIGSARTAMSRHRRVTAIAAAGVLILAGAWVATQLLEGDLRRDDFEARLLAALPAYDHAECIRVADREGAFHCTMSETSGSTLTAGDRLRVVCDETGCRYGWPVSGEYGFGDGSVGSFDCDRTCWQDVRGGYVYALLGDADEPALWTAFGPVWPIVGRTELGRIEWDVGITEESDYFAREVTTRDGRRASIDSVGRSADAGVHRVLFVSFPGHEPPGWKPTYPKALDTGATPPTPARLCADGYDECLPEVEDLACEDIPEADKPIPISTHTVHLDELGIEETGGDQYNLDRDGNGVGCEPDEPTAPPGTRYRLSLRTDSGRPLEQVRRDQTFDYVVSSPNLPEGMRTSFWTCVNRSSEPDEVCYSSKGFVAGQSPYRAGWQLDSGEGRNGVLTLSIKVDGRRVSSRSVPITGSP